MKSKLAMTAMIAFAAITVLTIPLAMAEMGEDKANHNKKHHTQVDVTDFVGEIQITENTNRQELKEQITVTLSEATASFPDAKKAKLGSAINENGEKFVVWLVVESNYDRETHTGTKYIHVIDAANSFNSATVTKEIDNTDRIQKKTDRLDQKINKITERLTTSSDNPERDVLKAEFLGVLTQLRNAIADGEIDTTKELKEQLKDLRVQLKEMKGD